MKCVCGYEYTTDGYDKKGNLIILKGDEEFIPINLNATIQKDKWSDDLVTAHIYACPKCGTLKNRSYDNIF